MNSATLLSIFSGFLSQSREYGIVILDPAGTILQWLGACSRVFGFTAEEMVGQHVSALFTEFDLQKGLDKLEIEIARTRGRSEDDRWHLRKDGAKVWISGAMEAVYDEHGALIGLLKLMRDRTDLRLRMDATESKLSQAEMAVERTRAFVRTLGHEMRNPLSPIQHSAAILRRTTTDLRANKAVDMIERQVAALSRMAEDMVEASRLEAGKVELRLTTEDLCDFLRNATEEFERPARQKGIDLVVTLPEGRLPVRMDRPRLHQAAANLLNNAIKYTPSSGKVWVRATQEGPEVVFRIEDTGMGIGPEMLPRLFDLFSRSQSAQKAVPGGLGVGLAVVKEVIELHGGTVQARSPGEGRGSEFMVRLPAVQVDTDTP